MATSKHLFQRTACLLKENTYFISTSAPFSSVLLPLPHKLHLLKPLLKQLTKKADFDLNQELSRYRLPSTEREIDLHSDYLTKHSIYGIQFDQETEFLVREGECVRVERQRGEGELLGVVLFGRVGGRQVREMSSNLWKINEVMLKLFVVGCLFKVCNSLENATRQENFSLLEKKK